MKYSIFYLLVFMLIGCKYNTNSKKEKLTQNSGFQKQFDSIENKIKEKQINDFEKKSKDLDGDGDDDFIYLYQCGESDCIDIYMNKEEKLTKEISELCFKYLLKENKILIKRNHCCGESPYTSYRTFEFKKDSINLLDNYVLFNDSKEFLSPKEMDISLNNYDVKIENDNYNIRFSPVIREYKEDESYFSCVPNTNIIGKLKKNSILKVLFEIKKEDRTWLFVEIKKNNLNSELCDNPINYNYKGQMLRAWISDTFTSKIEHY